MSSRLGKQVEHKTRQAEKLLQMLKQKREKKKLAQQNQANIHNEKLLVPDREPAIENKKVSNSVSNDSFRTCTNGDGLLGDLYFKIFSEHMVDANQAAQDLDNCYQNMSKQLIKVNEEASFTKQLLKNAKAEAEKAEKQNMTVVSKLNKEITNLQNCLSDERKKVEQLLERKNQSFNNSGLLNSSAIYEGYEEKIRDLTQTLETKEQQLKNVWDKNRDSQTQIFFLQKKEKNWEREKEEAEKQKQTFEKLIEKLRSEIKNKDQKQAAVNSQVLVLKQKQIAKLKDQYQKQMESLNKKIIDEQSRNQAQANSIKLQTEKMRSLQQKFHKELAEANNEINKMTEVNQMKVQQCNQLGLLLSNSQAKVNELSKQLKSLRQEKNNIEIQLNNKITLFSSMSDSTTDRIALLMQQKHELEQVLKDTKTQHEDIMRDLKTKIAEMETSKKRESDKWENKVLGYKNEISGLMEKNQELTKELEAKQLQVNQFINITEELTEQLTNAKQELDEYENRIMIMKQSNTELMQNRENYKKRLEELQAITKNMENIQATTQHQHQQQVNHLQQKIDKQQLDISELTTRNEKLKSDHSSMQQELTKIKVKNEQKLTQHEQNIKKLKIDNQDLQDKYEQLLKKYQKLEEQMKKDKMANLQMLAKASPDNANELIEQLTFSLKNELSQNKDTIESLNAELAGLKEDISKMTEANEQAQNENLRYVAKMKSMAEERNKDNAKYIKTIEQLTQELNQAYRKVNEHTRNSIENKGRDGSKQRNNRAKSVNKLKSYFGFGSKNEE